MNLTAIANHLNILESAIVRVEEWAHVLFVVAAGIGGRFVSKKVNIMNGLEASQKRQDENADRAEEMAAAISDALPIGSCPSYENLFSAACDLLEERCSWEQVMERFTNKKLIIKKK